MISPETKAESMAMYQAKIKFAGLIGEDGTEFSTPGYMRAPVSFGGTPTGLANGTPIMFPVAPVAWGRAIAVALFDAAGAFIISDPLAMPIDVRANDQVVLPPGAVAVEFEAEEIPV